MLFILLLNNVSLFPLVREGGLFIVLLFLVFFLLSFIGGKRGRSFSLICIVLISLYHVLSVATLSFSIPTEGRIGIMGEVIGNPGMTGKRKSSFDVKVHLVRNPLDYYATAKGKLHVISKETELYSGDRVILEGELLDEELFMADKVIVRKHSYFYELKRKCLSFVRCRLSGLPDDERELALRLILASGEEASYTLSESARSKGVSHVFALSGMHLELIFSFASYALIFIESDDKRRRLTLIPLIIFSFLSSFGASLLRALLMRGVKAMFPNLGEDEVLCYAFLIQSFISPYMILGAGGILSYMSIAAILLISSYADNLGKFLSSILITSGCLLATGFYSITTFDSFTLSGLVYSPVVSWIIRVYMTLLLVMLVIPLGFVPKALAALYKALMYIMNLPDLKLELSFQSSYVLIATVFILISLYSCGKKRGFTVSFLHCVEPELRKHNRT